MRKIKLSFCLWIVFLFVNGCASGPRSVKGPDIYLKEICAMYDIDWQWDSISQLVTLQKDQRKASVLLGSDVAIMGKHKIYLSRPLKREKSMIVVPVDFKGKIVEPLLGKTAKTGKTGTRPKVTQRRKVRKRPFRIVIDPGHGGKDPGAIGKVGLYEKNVVLDVSLRLKKILEVQGYDVKLTRTNDRFITLGQRTEISSRFNPDLFVSVHANASPARSARGVEVYTLRTLEPHEKTEEQREKNHDILFRNLKMKNGDSTLDDVVAEMMFKYKEAESRVAAKYLIHGVTQVAQAKNRGLRKSGFFVLRNTLIPAVLVELGFLSNAREEKLMETSNYRQKLANGLAVSIMKYAGK